jgi:hypothetical protein
MKIHAKRNADIPKQSGSVVTEIFTDVHSILCWNQPDIWKPVCQSYVSLSLTVSKSKIIYFWRDVMYGLQRAKPIIQQTRLVLKKAPFLPVTTKVIWSSMCSELRCPC